jgi:serine/threonine-protein kinase
MPLKTGDVIQNRYRIVRLVGQGGFGAVYRAWDINVSQPVALKENLGVDAEAQRQFEREATLLAGLRHPNLPRVTDHFIIPGQGQYLVMDFVEGRSLARLLSERGGPVPEADAVAWIQQVCDALTYLHTRRPPIIHRDIKPENVIINSDGRAILVDFGISKVYVEGGQTTVGAMAVTPGYSPPEQYGGISTEARSDVYALAATLYKLLTGQTPPESVAVMAMEVRVPTVREINPAVRDTTAQAIERAMTPTMSRRTPSAADFAAALSGQGAADVAPPLAAKATAAPVTAVNRATAAPAAEPSPVAPQTGKKPQAARSDADWPTLILLLVGAAVALALHWAAVRLGDSGLDYRIKAAGFGVAYTSILLVGAWGGPWVGALGGGLVGAVLHNSLFYWEWPFALVPVAVGFIAGLLARGGRMRSFFGAAWLGLLAAGAAMALDVGLRFTIRGDTSFDPIEGLAFLGGGVAAGLIVWLLARLVPRGWLARLPHGNRLR